MKRAAAVPVRADMSVPAGMERNCSIGDSIAILSDTWVFLVIREAFFGAKRFTEFSGRLGIPRATLAVTLRRLVETDILQTRRLAGAKSWKYYVLSRRGLDLYPVFQGLLWFGDKWLQPAAPPLALFHLACGSWFSPCIVWAETGMQVDPRDIAVELADDYWRKPASVDERRRRVTRHPAEPVGRRPCSVERALSIVGDRWTFLILREFFHGNDRFDGFMRNLPIASNILSDRLQRLRAAQMIERGSADATAAYQLTQKGRDMYGPMILLKSWGDRWLRPKARPTMHFVDRASRALRHPKVVCSCCRRETPAHEVRYITGYRLEAH